MQRLKGNYQHLSLIENIIKYSPKGNFNRYSITDISIYNAVAKPTPRNKQLANLMDKMENLNMFSLHYSSFQHKIWF